MPHNTQSEHGYEENYTWKILIVGGCYAGLSAAANLLDLCDARDPRFSVCWKDYRLANDSIPVQITIVDERDGFYHVIGSPLVLADKAYSHKAWVKSSDLAGLHHPSVRFVQGSVVAVDPDAMNATIVDPITQEQSQEAYDYLLVATGLRRPWPVVPQSLNRKTYLVETGNHIDSVKAASEGVVVIGGGAVGIEMAAELQVLYPELKVTLVHSRDKLLSSEPLNDEFKDRVLSCVHEAGVKTILGKRVKETREELPGTYTITFTDGEQIKAGHVISAISRPIPSTNFLPAGVLNEEGYVKITSTLNFSELPLSSQYHFAAGDICFLEGIKRCSTAMNMGWIAAVNIYEQLICRLFPTSFSEPKFLKCPEIPAGIGLAIGKQGAYYATETGIVSGEQALEQTFGTDLAFSSCWNFMALGKPLSTSADDNGTGPSDSTTAEG